SDPAYSLGHADCQRDPFEMGEVSQEDTFSSHRGVQLSDAIVFDAGVTSNTVTLHTPGPVVVCYCPLADSQGCRDATLWRAALRFTVSGPAGVKEFIFSAHVPVRFELEGHGLSSSPGYLRLIQPAENCSSNDGNPNTGLGNLYIGCPDHCSGVTDVGGSESNIPLQGRDAEHVRCDENNESCESVYITSVTVISASATEIKFNGNPGLNDGDIISLGDNISPGDHISAEEFDLVRGWTRYAGISGSYFLGNPVTIIPDDPTTVTIPVGWSRSPAPQIVVVTDSLGRGGYWYSHSQAATKEELISHSPITNAKLCYSYGQHNNYHAHVGRVTFVDPPQMAASIHLTARQVEARAPVIVEFRTGGDPAANPMY
ncbi:hypothetical protein FOZ63_006753, partial [Perkinsus olseni]